MRLGVSHVSVPFPSENLTHIINLIMSPTTQNILNFFFLPKNGAFPVFGFSAWMVLALFLRFGFWFIARFFVVTVLAVSYYLKFPSSEVDQKNGAVADKDDKA